MKRRCGLRNAFECAGTVRNVFLNRINKGYCVFFALSCCVLTALFVPFSTALTNTFSIMAMVFWFISADLKKDFQSLLSIPFARLLVFFLFFVCLSAVWNEGSWASYWSELRNYRRFIFLLIIFMLVRNRDSWREGMLFAFFISTAILTLICIGIHFGVPFFPPPRPGQGAIFHKTHIAQGFLLACHMVIAIRYAVFSKHVELRIVAAITAFLAFVVSVVMTYGRTGYLCVGVCLVMAAAFFLLEKRKRLATFFFVISALALVAGTFSSHVQTRWQNAQSDITQFYQGNKNTSMGLRFYFWQTSLKIIKDNPVIGVGCGAMEPTSCRYAVDSPNEDGSCFSFPNPHEDYLFVLAQYGIVGFLLWVAFFVASIRRSFAFSLKDKWTLWGVTSLYLSGSFFNTFSRDITECTAFVLLVAVLLAMQPPKENLEKIFFVEQK